MKFIAAAVQMLATDDKAANLAEAEHWLREAAHQGARLAVLPEVFIWRGSKKLERAFAEPIPGPTSDKLAGLARELKIYLVGGSILEEIPANQKPTTPACSSILREVSLHPIARFISSMSTWPTVCRCASRRPARMAAMSWSRRPSLARWAYRFVTICAFQSSIVNWPTGARS